MSTTTQAQHTPTPWRVLDGAILSHGLNSYGNFVVAEMPDRNNVPEDTANTAFIVHAVNCHVALLEALKTCEAELVTLKARLSEPYRSNVAAACEMARTAIAKAEGNL